MDCRCPISVAGTRTQLATSHRDVRRYGFLFPPIDSRRFVPVLPCRYSASFVRFLASFFGPTLLPPPPSPPPRVEWRTGTASFFRLQFFLSYSVVFSYYFFLRFASQHSPLQLYFFFLLTRLLFMSCLSLSFPCTCLDSANFG